MTFAHLRRTRSRSLARSLVRDAFTRTVSMAGIGGHLLCFVMNLRSKRQPSAEAQILKPLQLRDTRVVIFAHYDPVGGLSAADRHALSVYRAVGYQTCVVTTAPAFPSSDFELVDAVMIRGNVGFDFGSWASGIRGFLPVETRSSLTHLVLANNSMYGPLWQIDDELDRACSKAEVVGMTVSLELMPHLQSYFLSFSGECLKSEAFERFWSQGFVFQSKWSAIAGGELRWERYFRRAGFETSHLIPPRSRIRRSELTYFWSELIEAGLPFVKKSLFKSNYDEIDLRDWKERLAVLAPDYDPTLIESDLA